MGRFSYKGYCWSLGTTSFRTESFNAKIERQLQLLYEFWNLEHNNNEQWSGNSPLQARYYDFLKKNSFLIGDICAVDKKAKDAREKTSGLVDIGLLDHGRKLTQVGLKVLEISNNADFSIDNPLQIQKDSFLYLKQLLKTYNISDDGVVRPFIVMLKVLCEYQTISFNEFVYLLPLCTSQNYTELILNQISLLRNGDTNIDDIIINRLLAMPNYKEILEWFLSLSSVSQDDICEIGINRKSTIYDKPYFRVYQALKSIYLNNNKSKNAIKELSNAITKLKLARLWNNYIFTDTKKKSTLKSTIFDNISNENNFRIAFFKTMHLLKAKATLKDYADLNCRYLGLSDIFLFADNEVKLDIIPKHFFTNVINELYKDAYIPNNNLQIDCDISDISPILYFDNDLIINSINDELGLNINTIDEATSEYEKERYTRFNRLIDERFSNKMLIELLDKFENRDDEKLQTYITNNADIPTLFEYVLGIAWYKISDRKGKILDYIKLSLDANLLPKSHAVGGDADIVYEYEKTPYYPKHTLLLEATLADNTNQRRMELEPVSRHLGQHLLKNGNLSSYCIFTTTHLDINVLSDFRNRKNYPYYDKNDKSKKIKGMKITALESKELKTIIANNKKYNELYEIFENAYQADLAELDVDEWYQKYIVEKI